MFDRVILGSVFLGFRLLVFFFRKTRAGDTYGQAKVEEDIARKQQQP